MPRIRSAKVLQALWQLPSSYVGLSSRVNIPYFLMNVVWGPIWETLLFQVLLFGIPLQWVRKSWNVPWLPDPEFDRMLKWGIIIGSGLVSNYIFVTYHRPGHFGTLWIEIKAKRLTGRMEGAWLWGRFEAAENYARELLPVAEDWWVREGAKYARFLQALSLFVLSQGKGLTVQQQSRMKAIFGEVGFYGNDIVSAQTISEML